MKEMYNTMEEINRDDALKFLMRTCKRYNMPGVFIDHNPGFKSKESGIYFVTGIDKERIEGKRYNPAEMVINQKRNSKYYQPVKAFKITDCNPEVLFDEITMYCWDSEFVANVFPQYDMIVPKLLLESKVRSLAEFYTHTINEKYSTGLLIELQDNFRKSMLEMKERYSRKGLRGKWRDFILSNRYCDTHSLFRNVIHFIFRKRNKVDLTRVQRNSNGTINMHMELWRYKEFKKEVKKYPEVIFYKYPQVRIDTMGSCKKGTKPPKNGKFKFVCICLPVEAEAHVAGAYQEAVYKPEAPLTAEEIVNSGKPYNALVAPESGFFNYQSLFAANNVLYAIDPGYVNHPTREGVPILYFKKDEEMVKAIIFRLCNDMSSFHFIENEDAEALRGMTMLYGHLFEIGELEDEIQHEREHERKLEAIKAAQRKRSEKYENTR